ncbi:hypothetical protein OTU49_011240 [Cherax quadricarinatus]|uniref:Uncharacterized protein n=1 Tax=Cherax quadricarinatus TaxID=27406 RepID=A0AAW0WD51_CHEQU
MRAFIIIGVVVLATFHLAFASQDGGDQEPMEDDQGKRLFVRRNGVALFCARLNPWLVSTEEVNVDRTFWLLNPVNIMCRRLNTFLTTTGATIMQGAVLPNYTASQVLISSFRSVCRITRLSLDDQAPAEDPDVAIF